MSTSTKIKQSLQKVDGVELTLIPHRIQQRCIVEARSAEAKQKLVNLTTLVVWEDATRDYRSWRKPHSICEGILRDGSNCHQAYGHKGNCNIGYTKLQTVSTWSKIKNWIKSL